MNITFTGHRDRCCDPDYLEMLACAFPGAVWIHGGAPGFDMQVDGFARGLGIPCLSVRPDYKRYVPKLAPLMRNQDLVNAADLVVACYDGRLTGGTYDTKAKTEQAHKTLMIWSPL